MDEDFRGWITPDGEKVPINPYAEHDNTAEELFQQYYPGEDWDEAEEESADPSNGGVYYPSDVLFDRGWVALVSADAIRAKSLNNYKTNKIVTDLLWNMDPSDTIYLDIYDDRRISGSGIVVSELLDKISY